MSAVFAALTAIFAKIGVENVNSDFATLIRSVIIVGVLCVLLSMTGNWQNPSRISGRTWAFLTLSALATGASWLCYFRALQICEAANVAPIDTLSIARVAVIAVFYLGEKLSSVNWLGIGLIAAGTILVAFR